MSYEESEQQKMRRSASAAADVLHTLANENRLLLLCHLSQGESTVGELETASAIYQPTLSQQLGVMRRLNIVTTRREGKHIYYRISDPKVLVLLETLYQLYCPLDKQEKTDHDN